MSKLLASLSIIAGLVMAVTPTITEAAFPLTATPLAASRCSDPSFQFVKNGLDGKTEVDTSPARTLFCSVVATNIKNWN